MVQRLLEAAGMVEEEAGGKLASALGQLLGTSGTAAAVSVSQQVDVLVAVLSGLATQRSLVLAVEDAGAYCAPQHTTAWHGPPSHTVEIHGWFSHIHTPPS